MAKKGNKGGGNGGGGNDGGDAGGINEIRGNKKANTLVGTSGEDRILAGAGDDTVFAGDGNDFVWAEDGDDLIYGQGGNDELFGLNGNDEIYGGVGKDEVIGSNGADYLDGGADDDFLQGGQGEDEIIGGTGHDIAAFDDVGGYGTADLGIVLTYNGMTARYEVTYDNREGTSETDTVREVEEVWGSNFDDHMAGDSDVILADRFFGLQGFDTLDGGAGADVLFGGLDDDVLTGGAGGDTFVFLRRADGIVVPDNYEDLTDPPPLEAYEDAGTGDGIDIITDFQEADTLLFLSNENFTLEDFDFGYVDATETETETAYTWITYKAEPDFFGPSEVRILNQNLSEADLSNNIVIQVDADFAFDF